MNQLKYSTVSFNVLSENNIWGQHFDSIRLRPLLNFPFPPQHQHSTFRARKPLFKNCPSFFIKMAPLIPIKKILEPLYIAPSPANNETLTLYFLLCSASSSYIQSNVVLVHSSWFAFCMFFWHHCRSDFESKDPCILPPWKLSHQIIGKHSAVPSKLSGFQLYQFTQSPFKDDISWDNKELLKICFLHENSWFIFNVPHDTKQLSPSFWTYKLNPIEARSKSANP